MTLRLRTNQQGDRAISRLSPMSPFRPPHADRRAETDHWTSSRPVSEPAWTVATGGRVSQPRRGANRTFLGHGPRRST